MREVRDHFVRHRSDLDPAGPVATRERAEALEREVSIALYELGYGVLGDGLPPLLRRRQAARRTPRTTRSPSRRPGRPSGSPDRRTGRGTGRPPRG